MSDFLTDDTAALIARVKACGGRLAGTYSGQEMIDFFMAEIADALRSLAQENERLTEIVKITKERYRQFDAENGQLQARIRELEAEVRRLQNNEVNDCDLLGMHERRIAELEAECAAIRAKTIEECDRVAQRYGLHNLATAVALAQTDESKTESGE